jgi:cytochrome c biogenesis protein CcmG/thiol:disulfide interchange protein DsbE
MRRFLVPGLITCVAVGLLLVLGLGLADQSTNSSIDAQVARGHYPPAPDLHEKLPLLNGRGRESLAMLRGKVVLLNVFASWCQPCAAEAPLLERAQRLLSRHGGTVLGVTYLDNSVDSEAFMRKYHLTYPVVRDVNGNFVRAFGVTGVPETFVINRDGRIEGLTRYQFDNIRTLVHSQVDTQWIGRTLPKIWSEQS